MNIVSVLSLHSMCNTFRTEIYVGVSYETPIFSDPRHCLLSPAYAWPWPKPQKPKLKLTWFSKCFQDKSSLSYCLQKSTWFHSTLIFFTFFESQGCLRRGFFILNKWFFIFSMGGFIWVLRPWLCQKQRSKTTSFVQIIRFVVMTVWATAQKEGREENCQRRRLTFDVWSQMPKWLFS